MSSEACPFCKGTGQRLVPPPAKPHGGPQHRNGRSHGYVGTYTRGKCRCDLCRAAWREYARKRRATS